MSRSSDYLSGYETYNSVVSTGVAAAVNDRTAGQYLSSIEDGIQTMKDDFRSYIGNNNPQLKGYVIEGFSRGYLNIDALSKRTGEFCWTPPAIDFASVDIQTSWGEPYQLKYYNSGKHSAFAQSVTYRMEYNLYLSKLRQRGQPEISIQEFMRQRGIDPNTDPDLPIYAAQARLIPFGQILDARESLLDEIHLAESRGDMVRAARFRDTLAKLTDRIRSPKGAESLPLTEAEARDLAECARRGEFDPARYDITLAQKADYIYLCQNIALSGLTASAVSATLKAAPEMVNAFLSLIRDGYVTPDDIEKMGSQFKTGAKEGFLRGATVAAIKNACSLGYLGDDLKRAALDHSSPSFNAIVVVIVTVALDTASDSIRLSKGTMTREEFGYRLDKRLFISGCSVGMGTAVQGMMLCAPMLGYALGSFIGAALGGIVFEAKERMLMSLCVEKGYTFFGLVGQDYTLPRAVLDRIGIKVFETKHYETKRYETKTFHTKRYGIKRYEVKRIDFIVLKRGVIEVRKVGYV
jgi:hypothetical protein